MKQLFFKGLLIALLCVPAVEFMSCKSKTKDQTTTTPSKDTVTTAPVVISPDDTLRDDVKDATKDFPGVTATVNNGEVTLSGTITRPDQARLIMAVSAIHPKRINNNLTIK